jgi:hypothetical protein
MTNQVFINGVRPAFNKETGVEFTALDLIQIKPVTSKSGRDYLGTVKCSTTTPLSLEVAAELIGTTLPGTIMSVKLENPFKHTTKDGREVLVSYENFWVANPK